MGTHVISETFLSIEGEAAYSGHPTVYVRYAGCNMKCAGFNNPHNDIEADGYAKLPFDIIDVKQLDDIEEITVGCDSQYAVNPKFSHIWRKLSVDDLAQELVSLLPYGKWIYGPSNQQAILSLTGGEPTLRWKIIPELLNHPLLEDARHVLIETNCSVPLKDKFIEQLHEWVTTGNTPKRITWSNSPKLAVSGEPQSKAIRPDIAAQQMSSLIAPYSEQYFKFVCDDSDECFDEVEQVMKMYHEGGVAKDAPVYIMPMCCTEQQQQQIMMAVADKCIARGYVYCHRIHNTVYENAIGK